MILDCLLAWGPHPFIFWKVYFGKLKQTKLNQTTKLSQQLLPSVKATLANHELLSMHEYSREKGEAASPTGRMIKKKTGSCSRPLV